MITADKIIKYENGSESNYENNEEVAHTYDEAVELTGNGRYNIYLLITSCIISNAVGLDMFGFSITVATATCDLDLTMKQKGILNSIPFAALLFSYAWGYFADTRGRRQALLWSTSVGFIFSSLASIAWNWYMMAIFKFIGCSFSTAAYSLAMTFLGECTGSQHRGQYLLITTSINMASDAVSFLLAYFILQLKFSFAVPLLTITYRPWRLLTMLMTVPLAAGAVLMLFCHESPKFLANKGHTAKCLEVLRDIYEKNGGRGAEYPVKTLKVEGDPSRSVPLLVSLWQQTAPIFKPPLLWRTIHLYYLIIIICSTNNVFFVWFPTIVNSFYLSLSADSILDQDFCQRITANTSLSSENIEISAPCSDVISNNTIWAGVAYGVFFTVVTLVVSTLASWRRLLLFSILLMSAVSGFLVNVVTEPIAGMVFFVLIQGTAVGFGFAASYFVDLYPTSYRGMVSCLGMMVTRMVSFLGINVVGAAIQDHCHLTFYVWAGFVLTGVVACFFLPPDREKKTNLKDNKLEM